MDNSPSPLRRVLILKFFAIGDILIATPMLSALRAAHPGVRITWMVDRACGELLRGHPDVDDLWVVDTGAWRRLQRRGNLAGWLRRTGELRARVRAGNYDAVINCHPEKWWTALLCLAPRRVALYPGSDAQGWTTRLYNHPIVKPREPFPHDTRGFLLATRALGCPDADLRLTIGETADEAPFLRGFEAEHGVAPGAPLVVLAPFTTSETKCWEPDGFAAVAAELPRRCPGLRVVFTFGPGDEPAARKIADRAGAEYGGAAPILAAGTGLREYVALLRRASAVVSGDTSALHIAAALGTPYVTVFGPTDPERLAPLVGKGRVLRAPLPCSPCWSTRCRNAVWRECMKRVTPEQVLDALTPYLDGGAATGAAPKLRQELYVQ